MNLPPKDWEKTDEKELEARRQERKERASQGCRRRRQGQDKET